MKYPKSVLDNVPNYVPSWERYPKEIISILTLRCQVIFGGGLPFDSHSKVIVEPFRTTNLPSCGKGCTLGGTAIKKEKCILGGKKYSRF